VPLAAEPPVAIATWILAALDQRSEILLALELARQLRCLVVPGERDRRALRGRDGGRRKERQALADEAPPLEAAVAVLPARGGEGVVRRLFEPLGYTVEASGQALHPSFPGWGDAPYQTVDPRSGEAFVRAARAVRAQD
jgi:hypothetical protein